LLQCWQRDRIVTANNIEVKVLGAGQKIRGRRSGADRPTLIIADDLENADNTFSPDSRDKLRDIFEASIRMAGSEETNFIFMGNLYHPHCLLGEYIRDEKDNTCNANKGSERYARTIKKSRAFACGAREPAARRKYSKE